MAEGLKIVVGADVNDAIAALKKLDQQGKTTGQTFTVLSDKTNKLGSTFNRAPGAINKTKVSMTDLSRVVQDLPFGFTAISNNLTQLIPGVGLAGLAFSGLVAAITFSQVGMSGWSRGSKELSKEARDQKGEVDKATEAQEKFDAALRAAAGAVIGQAGELKALRDILVDVTNKNNELGESVIKQGIAQALFSQKSQIFEDKLARRLKDRINLTKGVTEATVDMFKPREFKGFEKTVGDVIGTLSDNKAVKTFKERIALEKDEERQLRIINDTAKELGINFEQFTDKVKKEANAKKDRIIRFPVELDITIPPGDQILKPAEVDRVTEGIGKGIITGIDAGIVSGARSEDAAAMINALRVRYAEAFRAVGASLPDTDFNIAPSINEEKIKLALAEAQRIDAITKSISATLQNIATDSIANLGETVGAALAGGDLTRVFANFGSIIGQGLQEIGKQLIAIGGLAKLTQKALASLFKNPGLAIAAGIGLIAAGAALKASLSKGVQGFAEGGLVFGPTMGLVGEGAGTTRSNPEVIAPLDQLRAMMGDFAGGGQVIVVAQRTRGTYIDLVAERSRKADRRLNGSRR